MKPPFKVKKSVDIEIQGGDEVASREKEPFPEAAGTGDADEDQTEYPRGLKLVLIVASCYLAIFLVALDKTIIVNAIPQITDEFYSLSDIGWYGSSYLLTGSSLILVFGKIYTFYATKWVFLTAISLFEIGSAICGAAPNSVSFIIGRAIAGVGSAGTGSGVILIMVNSVPLAKRPLYQGLFGAAFGIAAVLGPLLGGAFTDKVTWRWCFYINLPVGAIAMTAILFILKEQAPPQAAGLSFREKIEQLDPIGTFFFLPGAVCLLLALQWGGTQYSWNDGRVIATLVLAVLALVVFVAVQIRKGESATVPPRIIAQRSIASGFLYQTCVGGSMTVMTYYIAIWFQSVDGVSAVASGERLIALVLALVFGSIMAGAMTFKIGYYTPTMILSSIVASIGAGLITTWQPDTGSAKWIGYQVLYGWGLGLGMQSSNLAVQTVLSKKDIPIGSSLIFFAQSLGGAIFVSVAQNIFSNKLADGLRQVPGLDSSMALSLGVTDIRKAVPPEILDLTLDIFNNAFVDTFYLALAISCFGLVGALTMEWRSVKKGEGQGGKTKLPKGVAET